MNTSGLVNADNGLNSEKMPSADKAVILLFNNHVLDKKGATIYQNCLLKNINIGGDLKNALIARNQCENLPIVLENTYMLPSGKFNAFDLTERKQWQEQALVK